MPRLVHLAPERLVRSGLSGQICGSHQCCTSMIYGEKFTSCFHQCDGANSMMLCARDGDCRERARAWCGDDAACRRAVRCVPPSPDLPGATPPWMKVCRALN